MSGLPTPAAARRVPSGLSHTVSTVPSPGTVSVAARAGLAGAAVLVGDGTGTGSGARPDGWRAYPVAPAAGRTSRAAPAMGASGRPRRGAPPRSPLAGGRVGPPGASRPPTVSAYRGPAS